MLYSFDSHWLHRKIHRVTDYTHSAETKNKDVGTKRLLRRRTTSSILLMGDRRLVKTCRGGVVREEGQRAPFPPATGPGERCKLPQRGSGRSLDRKSYIATAKDIVVNRNPSRRRECKLIAFGLEFRIFGSRDRSAPSRQIPCYAAARAVV